MSEILVSVVVPCYNASNRVRDTLQSLALQTQGATLFEVLVIDNNSSDRDILKDLVDTIGRDCGNFRFLDEAKPGLNEVRRAGAEHARGRYVMYIDDDAVPLCSYVERITSACLAVDPDVIGGSLVAFPEAAVERCFDHTFNGWWSLRHYGPADRWLGDGEYFLGANIGARRSILLDHGFDPARDRKGSALIGGGELWLGSSRYKRWYCATIPVFHKISLLRMNRDYLSKRIISNLTAQSEVAPWSAILLFGIRSLYTPLKTAVIQILFRLSLVAQICSRKLGS